ncbi:GGDEF domain-containing protein [Paenibacillus sp. TRM 82003]|uniref:GGDEF domain-containing protein n=1 Tax=Kineococcus sp. TRM81007 TaxID=2925831 RepID=UPI001F59311F|nr:GGDEF domain-containing protein [Kineococcus sp. TRM81007]MCI2237209.1 GGDEF domain-containing protein [Kineococcus sp. TRM81007]MCI3925329.1 GGDEF domain-containing protein [Paenibacillus sp. TRM 82003]
MRPTGPRSPARLLLAAGAVAALVCALLPLGALRDGVYALVCWGSVAAVVVGIRRNRPREPAAWWLVAAGVASWGLGDLTWDVVADVLHGDPFPSAADVFYLLAYPLLAAGLWRFVRARTDGRDRDGLIDSAVFTVGVGLLMWVFLVQPALGDTGATPLARVVAAAYPVGDVLLLALLVRLLTTGGARDTAFRLLAAAGALSLLADSAFQLLSLDGGDGGRLLDAVWLVAYTCYGAAALHPSMRCMTDRQPRTGVIVGRARLVALTAASLLSPATQVLQLALGLRLTGWAVALSSVALFLLVVWRMSGLVAHLQQQAAQLAALARTDTLTGLANRRSGDAELARMQVRARQDGTPLSLAVLDLDRFKVFNDTFGHQAGDRLLTEAAAAWKRRLRGTGALLVRWGGEEFTVLLPGHDLEDAAALVEQLSAVTPAGQTFSAGVARWDGEEDPAELTARADRALYRAKAAGRSRVLTAAAPPGPRPPDPVVPTTTA